MNSNEPKIDPANDDWGEQSEFGVDLARLRYARSLTIEERLERNRRAVANMFWLMELREKHLAKDESAG